MSNPPRGKSYSQVMNEWAAQRSFINRLRSRLFFPPYDAPWYGKLWGYVWRLGSVIIVVFSLLHIILKARFGTESFRGHLAEEVAKRYHATNVTCGHTAYPMFQSGVMVSAMGADGTPDSIFNRMDAYELGFDLGWQFLRSDWKIDRLRINRLEMNLKSGSSDAANGGPGESEKSTPAPLPNIPDRVVIPSFKTGSLAPKHTITTAGFALKPDFQELKINSCTVGDLFLTWGYSTTTSGGISNAPVTLDATPDGGWDFVANGGKLSQNWLTDLKIQHLEAHIEEGELRVNTASFTHGDSGRILIQGSMELGDIPKLDFTIAGESVNLKPFMPAPFNKYFDGTGSFSGTMNGSINRASGVTTKLDVKLVPPANHGRNVPANTEGEQAIAYFGSSIPALRALYLSSGEDRLVQPGITEGSFHMETGGGVVKISKIDLRAGDFFRLRGAIESREELEEDHSLRHSTINDLPPKITYRSSGEIFIGLKAEIVHRMAQTIQHQFFTQEEGGYSWMRAPFQNEDGQDLTKAVGDEINRLMLEAGVQRGR